MRKTFKTIVTAMCVSAVMPMVAPFVAEAKTNTETSVQDKKASETEVVSQQKKTTTEKKAETQKSNSSKSEPEKDTTIEIEGEKVKVQKKGNQWVNLKGYWHFVKDGQLAKGWRQMSKADGEKTTHWSYFDSKNGRLYTGWHQMGKAEGEKTVHWSYFGDNGWLRTGWQQMGKGTGNSYGENTAKHWSYFGGNGWLRTGWVQLGKGTSEPDGNSAKHWSYFGGNGWLRTGMQSMGTSANPDGNNKQHNSFFGGNGWLVVNKRFTCNKLQYMADSNGWIAEVGVEYDKTISRARQLVAKVTKPGMSKEQKLRACFIHIRDNYKEYRPRTPHYSGKGWDTLYANDIFINKGGNCFSYGAALAYMAKAIGYEKVFAVYAASHGWAEIDGKVYDPEWEKNHKGSFYALNYDGSAYGKEKYNWIFGLNKPYGRVKL